MQDFGFNFHSGASADVFYPQSNAFRSVSGSSASPHGRKIDVRKQKQIKFQFNTQHIIDKMKSCANNNHTSSYVLRKKVVI